MAARDFKGVWIPKQIWLDTRLNALDKVIFVEIDSLDVGENGCWASNEYLADFCQCSTWKISSAIKKLTENGYITVESFDGRKRKIKSCLSLFKGQPCENQKSDFGNPQGTNIDNNTENNTNNSKNTSYSCSEPEKSVSKPKETKPDEPIIIEMDLRGGETFGVTKSQYDKYVELYPAVDVMQELRKMVGWLDSNPERRKGKSGIKRFITNWLSKEQDRGGSYRNNYQQPSQPKGRFDRSPGAEIVPWGDEEYI